MKLKKTIHYVLTSMLILSNLYFPIKADASTSFTTYKVKKGDTLYGVAKKYHLTTTQIQKDNHLKSSYLKAGQVLKIQVTTHVTIIKTPSINHLSAMTTLNASSYVISGSAEKNATVTLTLKDNKNKSLTYTVKADSKGKFTTKINVSRLTDGNITLTTYQKNTKGVKSSNTVKSILKDTIGPSISFQIVPVSSSNKLSFNIKGNSETNSTISLSVSDKKHPDLKKTVTTDSKGKFSTYLDVHSLNDGQLTIHTIAKDRYGNLKSSTIYITKDTVLPIITLDVQPISSNNQTSYPISGITEPNSTVKIAVSDNKTTINSTINTDSKGKFTKNIDIHALNDGNITIDITVSDKGGNTSNKKVSIAKSVSIPLQPITGDNRSPVQTQKTYELDAVARTKWNIYNDGTHATETTNGLNDALVWAHDNGYNVFHVPTGTYLIAKGSGQYDPTSYITMPSDMTLLSDDDTIYQKETNSYHGYNTLLVPMWAENVTIKGGTFVGDKDTHNFYEGATNWEADHTYNVGDKVIPTNTVADVSNYYYYYVAQNTGTSGTDEPTSFVNSKYQPNTDIIDGNITWKQVSRNPNDAGVGISVIGAFNVTVDGVKTTKFIGDGLMIGGKRAYYDEFYEGSFMQGGLDDLGKPTADATKIRLKQNHNLTDPSFAKTHTFEIDNINWSIAQKFDVYFYKADGSFLSKVVNQSRGMPVAIPIGATTCNLVFASTLNSNLYMEFHNKIVSQNVTIKNSDSSFNRRQGLTLGGGNNILITGNEIHDITGAAPQSGIDVEGGFYENGMLNTNFNIKGNHFYNNITSVILYDGDLGLVEGNHFDHKGGLYVSPSYGAAYVKDNKFDGAGLGATDNTHMFGNTFIGAYADLNGTNITMDGDSFINNANFVSHATEAYGITVSNLTFMKSYFGVKDNPITLNNLTMDQYTPNTMVSPSGIIFNNLKVTDNIGNGGFVPGTYNNCSVQTPNVNQTFIPLQYAGKYEFNNCSFGGATTQAGLKIYSPNVDVTVKNSIFNFSKDVPAILVEKANSIDIENSTITSNATTGSQKSVVMIGDDWTNANATSILKVVLKGNTIASLAGANAISTIFAGSNASSFDIENNILYNGKLQLKQNDINLNNQLLTK